MRILKLPDVWFLIGLLALTAGGAVALARPEATDAESRRMSYSRHPWQAAFDALSATCGAGLLTYDYAEDYTPRGRRILTLLGVAGAALYLAAAAHALRRIRVAGVPTRVPHPLLVVAAFVVVQAAAVGAYLLASRAGPATDAPSLTEAPLRAVAAFSSLGWATSAEQSTAAWPLTLLAWVGALGWPMWFAPVAPLARRFGRRRTTLAVAGGYVAALLVAAVLIAGFEAPRGMMGRDGPHTHAARQTFSGRFVRALHQTTAASAAGLPTEPLDGANATDATKVTLALLLIVGGLGGSATGGVQWPLLLWAAAGALGALGWLGSRRPAPDVARWMHAGLACVVIGLLLAGVVAGGMLLLENIAASPYQPAPTFADAFLDAASITAGGGLTTGVVDAVTGPQLEVGIGRKVSLYAYGMVWLMFGLLAGRMVPLMILRRVGSLAQRDPARKMGPVGLEPTTNGL